MKNQERKPIQTAPDPMKVGIQVAFIFSLYHFGHRFCDFLNTFSFFSNNQFTLFVVGTWLLHQFVFWTGNAFLTYLDLMEQPSFLFRYKIQEKKIGTKGHWKCFKLVLFNQVIFLPIMLYIGALISERIGNLSLYSQSSWIELVLKLVMWALVEEIGFYYSHRLIHFPPFYGWIHKIHHEFKYPVGTASEYAHPIEFVISNVFPLLTGPLLSQIVFGNLAIAEIYFWATLAITATINGHSGYELPYVPFKSARFHDLHHEVFDDNFGAIGFLDYLHGTQRIPTVAIKEE